MPNNLKDLRTITTFLKNFFTKVVLSIKGKVEVQNFPEVQKVEVSNPTESYKTVEVSNLSELQKTVETSLVDVVKELKEVSSRTGKNKPEKAKEDLLKSLRAIKKELAVKPEDRTHLVITKLDELVKGIEKIDTTTDIKPIVNELQTVIAGLDFFKNVKRFDEIKVRLPDKQIEKIAKSMGSAIDSSSTQNVTLEAGDIEIGAVEIKDGTTDTRIDFGQQVDTASLPIVPSNALVPEKHDYIDLDYNASRQLDTVTFKTGGSGGTTVATLALVYTGDGDLDTVTKS